MTGRNPCGMLSHMNPGPSALERVFQPAQGDLPLAVARELLKFDFPPEDHARYEALSEKAQLGTLTPDEQADLDDLLAANDVLMILRAKAQISINKSSAA